MEFKVGELLQSINNPDDLRKIKSKQLPQFCDELSRASEHCLGQVTSVSRRYKFSLRQNHYVFNTPEDIIVWDVGHQAYGHKILTGRKNKFHTQGNGLSGFTKRSESEYDTFGVGHSSTSISAALGQ